MESKWRRIPEGNLQLTTWRLAPLSTPSSLVYSPACSKIRHNESDLTKEKAMQLSLFSQLASQSSNRLSGSALTGSPEKALLRKRSIATMASDIGGG